MACEGFAVIRNERLQVFRGRASPCNLCPKRGGKGEGNVVMYLLYGPDEGHSASVWSADSPLCGYQPSLHPLSTSGPTQLPILPALAPKSNQKARLAGDVQ